MRWGVGLAFAQLPLKRFYKYVLKRLIGGFLKHDIDLEQLDVQLYHGIVQLKSLELDVAQFNLAAMGTGIMLHFASGLVGCIKMDIPWRHLLRDHCKVWISGVDIVLAKDASVAVAAATAAAAAAGCAGGGGPSGDSAEQAAGGDSRDAQTRYSDEGIETLSRLVRQVLSQMELCLHDTRVSVLAHPEQPLLRARLSSVVVLSSEGAAGGLEARSAHVAGLNLALVPSSAAGPEREEVVLLSTDMRAGEAAEAGMLRLSHSEAPLGVHLDVELALHCVRVALAPASWQELAGFLAALQAAEEPSAAAEELPHPEPEAEAALAAKAPLMVQSMMESSLSGSQAAVTGYWHELYTLFEQDAALEDAAGGVEHWEEGPAEGAGSEASEDEPGASSRQPAGEASRGPVVGYSVRVRVAHAGAVLALGAEGHPRPCGVPVVPGAAAGTLGDQAQLCMESWEVTVMQLAAGSGAEGGPSVTGLVRSLAVFLHRRSDGGQEQTPMQAAASALTASCGSSSGRRFSPASRRPEEYTIHSWREGDSDSMLASGGLAASRSSVDGHLFASARGDGGRSSYRAAASADIGASMFCSAMSRRAEELRPAEARVVRTPSPASCRCSTDESVGGEESDSASSRSLSPAGAGRSGATGSAAAGEENAGDREGAFGAAGDGSPVSSWQEPRAASGEDLEAIFFDRSRSVGDALFGSRACSSTAVPSATAATPIAGQGWSEVQEGFLSKRLLHLEPAATPEGHQVRLHWAPASHGRGGPGGPAGAADAGAPGAPRAGGPACGASAAAEVRCQPVVLSLCADSIGVLGAAAALLQARAGPAVPAPRPTPPPALEPAAERSAASGGGEDEELQACCYALSVVAPLVRVELDLSLGGEAPARGAALSAELAGLRLLAGATQGGRPPGMAAGYEEQVRAELGGLEVFFARGAGAAAPREAGAAPPRRVRLLALGPPQGAPAGPAGLLSLLRRQGPPGPPAAGASGGGAAEDGGGGGASPAAAAALSEWTKITVPDPLAGGSSASRSDAVLQDLRDASQRILRPGHGGAAPGGPRRGSARAPSARGSREFDAGAAGHVGYLADAGAQEEAQGAAGRGTRDGAGDTSSTTLGVSRRSLFEVDIQLPGVVGLQADAVTWQLLQEEVLPFAARLPAGAAGGPTTACTPRAAEPRQDDDLLPTLGVTVATGCLQLDLVDGPRAVGAVPERLRLRALSASCRLVQVPEALHVCCLSEDVRFEGVVQGVEHPDVYLRPWFRPLNSTTLPDGPIGGEPRTMARTTWRLPGAAWQPFTRLGRGQWRETHCAMLQVERREAGADRSALSLQLSRLVLQAHPFMHEVGDRLVAFFNPPVSAAAAPQPQPPCAGGAAATFYEAALLDCLVDLPSEAHAREWPTTSPMGLHVPTPPPTSRGAGGDKWRAVLHLDACELSCCATQGMGPPARVEVGARECNVFVVDHPNNLTRLELLSTDEPCAKSLLAGLGFARVLEVDGARAEWQQQCGGQAAAGRSPAGAGGGPGRGPGAAAQSLAVRVEGISGRVCADTLKCLLCAGAELADSLPRPGPPGHEAGAAVSERRTPAARPTAQGAAPPSGREAGLGRLDGAPPAGTPSSEGLCILDNIDMFAFEAPRGAAAPAGTPTGPDLPAVQLESLLIHDYIQSQEQQQMLRSPVQAATEPRLDDGDGDMETLFLPDLDEEGAASANEETDATDVNAATASEEEAPSSHVAVCLLDPEALQGGRLEELSEQDRAARREVDQLFHPDSMWPWEDLAPELRAPAPATLPPAASKGGPAPLSVLQEEGSTAVLYVDPAGVQVVDNHFTRRAEPKDDRKLLPPAQAPPTRLLVTLRCESIALSLHGGSDFEAAAPGCPPPARASRRSLTLRLQRSVAQLMLFDAPEPSSASLFEHSGDVYKRRLLLCAKDFCVLDRVQGSVFEYLLAYWEDERERPRPTGSDMLHLHVAEVGAGGALDTPMYRVDLRLLPLRLTIDQDAVQFILDFVQLCALPTYVEEEPHEASAGDHTPRTARPVGTTQVEEVPAQRHSSSAPWASRAAAPLFQHVSVGALLVSVDYKAKRLDVDALRRGELWELVNLLPLLEGLQIPLRGVYVRGAVGADEVMLQVVQSWSSDLNRTQILRSLIGVTPIRSFANIGGGLAEVVLESLKQYHTGGGNQHISRTVLRGTVSFLKHVTVESIDLTERIFVGTQSVLEYVDTCLSEGQEAAAAAAPAAGSALAGAPAALARAGSAESGLDGAIAQAWTPVERGAADFLQPGGAREGLQQASSSLMRGVRDAGQAVVMRPLLEFQRGASRERVLRSVVTGIPMCVLRPAIGATAAVTTALRGVRHSVDPVRRRELVRKYKGPQ